MPGCDNKSWTISVWRATEAHIKAVFLNTGIQFSNWFKIGISWNKKYSILEMICVFKCLCSWYQCLVVIIKVEQFRDDDFLKPKSMEFH